MTTALVPAIGCALSKGATPIADVTDISGPAVEVGEIDATSHDSVGLWGEKVPGRLSMGDLTLTINYIPTNATHSASAGILYDIANRVIATWTLAFSDTGHTAWSFSAFPKSFTPKAPSTSTGKLEATVVFSVTGQPTLA